MNRFTQKIIVAFLFVGAFIAAHLFGVGEYLSLMGIQMLLDTLHAQVVLHPVLAAVVFVGAYIGATGFSVPGATFLTLLAGALFGTWIAVVVVNIGATRWHFSRRALYWGKHYKPSMLPSLKRSIVKSPLTERTTY